MKYLINNHCSDCELPLTPAPPFKKLFSKEKTEKKKAQIKRQLKDAECYKSRRADGKKVESVMRMQQTAGAILAALFSRFE